MKTLEQFKMICEYLGGSRDNAPMEVTAFLSAWWWRGLWWGLLVGGIMLFCTHTSKFIYIDF